MKALLSGNTKRGFATLEILIAFTILILTMTAVIVVAFSNQSASVDTQTNSEAYARAEALLEQARAAAQQNFSAVVSQGSVTERSGPISYTKKLDVADLTPYSKQATSTVTWQSGGRTLNVVLSTMLTDPASAFGASKCSAALSGDWTAPQIYGYADFSSSAGATGVSVQGAKAFVTSNPSSAGTDDFYAVDVSAAGPAQTGLPILGHFSTSYGLNDVRAVGKYAYVAANSALYQLLIIDISDPTALTTAKIAAKKDVTAAGDTAVGNTLFYANKKIYLGLTMSAGKEFHIIDVSNPASPAEVGPGYEVGAAINNIVVKNNIAYLATAASNEIIALNVADPANPTLVGTYASATLTGQSLAFDPNSTMLYFGRIGGTGNPKLLAFDSGNLSAPQWTMDMSKQSGVYTAILRSNLLFMTTADPNDGLQIWDIANASALVPPVRHDTTPLNIQQTSTAGTDCYGNLLYVAQRSQRALQVIGPYVPKFDYTLAPSPAALSVKQGSTVSATVTVDKTAGTASAVTLSASGMQNNVTVTTVPASGSCTPNSSCTVTVTFTAAANAQKKTNTITITGASATYAHTTSVSLTVN